jgi:N-acetylmuramoyl-L-alanine amidase
MTELRRHVVQEGETLPAIAKRFGFQSHKPIFDHPANAELKKRRPNPNVLNPGDVVFVPERESRVESRPTDQRHRFRLEREELILRIKVLDLNEDEIERLAFFRSDAGADIIPRKANAYETDIQPDTRAGELRITRETPPERDIQLTLDIGGLDPREEPHGQQDRLNNLGYFAGFSRKSIGGDQFRWAVEEFQCDHRKSDGLKVTGACDSRTQQALQRRHGV